jgi:hypothetical protein
LPSSVGNFNLQAIRKDSSKRMGPHVCEAQQLRASLGSLRQVFGSCLSHNIPDT